MAIINRHEEAVRVLLDVLPQLPETSTAVIDMKNHLNQVCTALCSTKIQLILITTELSKFICGDIHLEPL